MTLKLRAVVLVTVVSLALIVSMGTYLHVFLEKRIQTLEEEIYYHISDQLALSVETTLDKYRVIARDWAVWDDMFRFTETKDPAFTRSNFTTITLSNFDADAAAILDLQKKPLYVATGNAEPKVIHTLVTAPDILEHIVPTSATDKSTVLLLDNQGRHFFIIFHSIYKGTAPGSPNGYFLLIRNVDYPFLRHATSQLRYEVALEHFPANYKITGLNSGPLKATYADVVLQNAQAAKISSIWTHSDSETAAFGISTVIHRSFYDETHTLSNQMVTMLVIMSIGMVILILLLLHKFIFRPFITLKSSAELIADTHDISHRIATTGVPEIDSVARAFNRMLRKIGQYHEEMQLQQEYVSEQSRHASLGQFASAVAHQWRQPLNTIALVIQDIDDSYRKGKLSLEEMEESVGICLDNIMHLTNTIEDIRKFHLDNSSDESIFLTHEAIHQVLSLVAPQLKRARITHSFTAECPQCELNGQTAESEGIHICMVEGRVGEFRQVILSIIENAVYEMKQKDAPDKDIQVVMTCAGKLLRVTIFNTGTHIPEDSLEKIFEQHFTTKPKEVGTGIGLSLAKMIIQTRMKGKIWAENRENGVAFIIELPVTDKTAE